MTRDGGLGQSGLAQPTLAADAREIPTTWKGIAEYGMPITHMADPAYGQHDAAQFSTLDPGEESI